jgi:hypothetical protein
VDDSLTRNYLVFLLLMLGLVMLVALLVLGLRPIFDRLMNAAFDKLGLKETIDFKLTSGPIVTKTREIHDLSELPPELANNPKCKNSSRATQYKSCSRRQQWSPWNTRWSTQAATVPLTTLEFHCRPKRTPIQRAQRRKFAYSIVSPICRIELANNPQIKSFLARSKGVVVPREKSTASVDSLSDSSSWCSVF